MCYAPAIGFVFNAGLHYGLHGNSSESIQSKCLKCLCNSHRTQKRTWFTLPFGCGSTEITQQECNYDQSQITETNNCTFPQSVRTTGALAAAWMCHIIFFHGHDLPHNPISMNLFARWQVKTSVRDQLIPFFVQHQSTMTQPHNFIHTFLHFVFISIKVRVFH